MELDEYRSDDAQERFRIALERFQSGDVPDAAGIGTLSEKQLHLLLKYYSDPDASHYEIPCCGCVADICDGMNVTEIQTGGFFPLQKKLPRMLDEGYTVTVVMPVASVKWLVWIDPQTGAVTSRRRSPKKGTSVQLLLELIHLLPLLGREGLAFRVVFLEWEEYRNLDGWSRDRKKGSTRYDRVPLRVTGEEMFAGAEDFRVFLPDSLTDPFTVASFSRALGLTRRRGYTALRVLREFGLAEECGKNGRERLYRRAVLPDEKNGISSRRKGTPRIS